MKIGNVVHTLNPQKWAANYTHLLRNFARIRVSDNFVVEELIQETFLAGLNSQKNYKGQAKESTWLVAILQNKIVDYYRSNNSHKGKALKNTISTEEYSSTSHKEITEGTRDENDVYDVIYTKELKSLIDESFNSLSEMESRVLKMKIEDHNTTHICKALKINQDNCWVIIHRARQKIRNHINSVWPDTV